MKIYQDINLSEFKFWSGAKAWAAKFTSEELDKIGDILEDDAPEDGWSATAVNDLFWFEPEFVASLIGKIIPDLAEERFDAAISAVIDEINIFLARQVGSLYHLFNSGIGHHTGQFHHLAATLFQFGHHLVVDTISLDTTATIAKHHLGAVILQFFTQFTQCILTEVQLRGIVKCKVT